MKTKSFLTILIISVIFHACQKKEKYFESKELSIAIDSLAKKKYIYFPSEDSSPEGRKPFDNFVKIATENDLIHLTEHKNPKIRCYAFLILVTSDYTDVNVREIFEQHLKDTIRVDHYLGGCQVTNSSVRGFMLKSLYFYNTRNRISQVEYDNYSSYFIREKG